MFWSERGAIGGGRAAQRGKAHLRSGRPPGYEGVPVGRLAQLVERLLYTQDVGGSSPSSPTILFPNLEKSPNSMKGKDNSAVLNPSFRTYSSLPVKASFRT